MSNTRREPVIAASIILAGIVLFQGYRLVRGGTVDRGAYLAHVHALCGTVDETTERAEKAFRVLGANPSMIGSADGDASVGSIASSYGAVGREISGITDVPIGCGGLQDDLIEMGKHCDKLADDLNEGVRNPGGNGIANAGNDLHDLSFAEVDVMSKASALKGG